MGFEDAIFPFSSQALTVKTFTAFSFKGTGIENSPPSPGTVPLFVTPAPFTCTLISAYTGTTRADIEKSTITRDKIYSDNLLMDLIILPIFIPLLINL